MRDELEVGLDARHRGGCFTRLHVRFVLWFCPLVQPSGGWGGRQMIVILGAALMIFIYLVFALINPERF